MKLFKFLLWLLFTLSIASSSMADISDYWVGTDGQIHGYGLTLGSGPIILNGVTLLPTGTELNYVDGAISNIQTQINALGGGAWIDYGCNAIAYGATTSDIQTGIAAAIVAGCRDVYIPANTYTITTGLTVNTSGVKVRGASDGGTIIVWNGADYATMASLGGSSLKYDISIENIQFDANGKASTFIDVLNVEHGSITNVHGKGWKGLSAASPGYSMKFRGSNALHTIFYTITGCTFTDPSGNYAYGVTIGPDNHNVNNVTFLGTQWQISPVVGAKGIRLGYVDHIYFLGSMIWSWDNVIGTTQTPIWSVVVAPPSASSAFPTNIGFGHSPMEGGMAYDMTDGTWGGVVQPAILFYPFHTADSSISPPLGNYTAGAENLSTVASSTTVTTTNNAFASVVIGSSIYANGITRYVTAKASSNSITINIPTNWSAGYAFAYTTFVFPSTMFSGFFDDGTTMHLPKQQSEIIASGTAITISTPLIRLTGTTTVQNIYNSTGSGGSVYGFWNRPYGGFRITVLPDSSVATGTAGNIQEAVSMSAGRSYDFQWSSITEKWHFVGGISGAPGEAIQTLAFGGTGASLTDPGANRLWGWDDTDNSIAWMTLGTGLSYEHSSHTLNAVGGAIFRHDYSGTTWTITHNLGNSQVMVQLFDSTGKYILPESITHTSTSVATAVFSTSVTGYALVSGGSYAGATAEHDTLNNLTYATAGHIGFEASLGNPTVDDYVLSSTIAGVRSWIASGTAGSMATDVLWNAAGDLAIGTGANTGGPLTKGAEGTILRSGASTLGWSTPTYPNAATTIGTYIRADGTNFIQSTLILPNSGTIYKLAAYTSANTLTELAAVGGTGTILTGVTGGIPIWTTATYPATVVAGELIHASATNVIGGLGTALTTQLLVGGGSGVAPIWTTATGTGAPVRAGSPTFTTQITTPIVYGSASASGNLTLGSTSHATKGKINIEFGTTLGNTSTQAWEAAYMGAQTDIEPWIYNSFPTRTGKGLLLGIEDHFISNLGTGTYSWSNALQTFLEPGSSGPIGTLFIGLYDRSDQIYSGGIGPVALSVFAKPVGTWTTGVGPIFGGWFNVNDAGKNLEPTGIEIDVVSSRPNRTLGSVRGMTLANFPSALSNNGVDYDWGVYVLSFGQGIVFDSSGVTADTSAVSHLYVRNQGSAATNAKTSILTFASSQVGPYLKGLDFTNATFSDSAIDATGKVVKTGLVITSASTTAAASLRLPHGSAPTTGLTDGDMWTTTAGLYVRINSGTVGPLGSGSMSWPGAGIAVSTGTAWGTSLTTSGTGTVVALATSPTLTTPNIGAATGTSLGVTGAIQVASGTANSGTLYFGSDANDTITFDGAYYRFTVAAANNFNIGAAVSGTTTGATLVAGGDGGGLSGYLGLTNATAAASSCGSLSGAVGCIKIYIGETARYVPYW